MSHIIRAKNLHKVYRMGQTSIEVLKGLDLEVKQGHFLAIVGASGSGKSTLLHILGALDNPNAGCVEFKGQRIDKFTFAQMNNFRNKMVGFVFQFYHLLDELNVLENVFLPAMASKDLLERLELDQRINHKPFQLSGGQRQRVAIARALINKPPLLLADEPTGNLDSETGNGILNVLEELNNAGQTILMVTHNEKIARRAKEVITLADGKIA